MFAGLVFRVEDHDDLMPIFSQLTNELVDTYGDYYLAELIEAQDDHMKCIVAEVYADAVNFSSLGFDVCFKIIIQATGWQLACKVTH